jgi:mersacidin/lichenicidin family type 2 lantibiotic
MSKLDIIRAWKDQAYRNSLTAAERASLPANPAGVSELDHAAMESVNGGAYATLASRMGLVIQAQPSATQTITSTIDVCCSTGDLPCDGNTQDLLCIVVK